MFYTQSLGDTVKRTRQTNIFLYSLDCCRDEQADLYIFLTCQEYYIFTNLLEIDIRHKSIVIAQHKEELKLPLFCIPAGPLIGPDYILPVEPRPSNSLQNACRIVVFCNSIEYFSKALECIKTVPPGIRIDIIATESEELQRFNNPSVTVHFNLEDYHSLLADCSWIATLYRNSKNVEHRSISYAFSYGIPLITDAHTAKLFNITKYVELGLPPPVIFNYELNSTQRVPEYGLTQVLDGLKAMSASQYAEMRQEMQMRSPLHTNSAIFTRRCAQLGRETLPGVLFRPPAAFNRVCLIGIVKDEAPVICRMLASVKNIINMVLLCDTGSKDGTQQLVTNFLTQNGIAGEVMSAPWEDFAHNRSWIHREAFQRTAGKVDYCMWLDADEVLMMTDRHLLAIPEAEKYPTRAEANALLDDMDSRKDCGYGVMTSSYGNLRYPRFHFSRNCQLFYWNQPVHEQLRPTYPTKIYFVESMVDFVRKEGNSSRNPGRHFCDVAAMGNYVTMYPDDTDAMFYLAQCLHDVGCIDKAIELYLKRVEMANDHIEQKYIALLRVGRIYMNKAAQAKADKKHYEDEALKWWNIGYRILPKRIEIPFEMLQVFVKLEQYHRALHIIINYEFPSLPDVSSLFCELDIWEWKYLGLAMSVAHKTYHYDYAIYFAQKLIEIGKATHLERIAQNVEIYRAEKIRVIGKTLPLELPSISFDNVV